MDKVGLYKEHEESRKAVNEPGAEYSIESQRMDYLPEELLVDAIKYVRIAREKGRMIPNQNVYGLLSEKLGWK